MLNWLYNTAQRHQRQRRNLQISMGVGLLLGLGLIGQQELFALESLAAKAPAQDSVMQPLPGSVPVNSFANSQALNDAKKTLSDLITRQASLARRQAQREDISEVQAVWRMNRELRTGGAPKAITLRTHQFQNGLFTWEAVAEQSYEISALLQALNRFPGWSQAPVLVQVQSELTLPNSVTAKGMVFLIQADLDGKQGKGS